MVRSPAGNRVCRWPTAAGGFESHRLRTNSCCAMEAIRIGEEPDLNSGTSLETAMSGFESHRLRSRCARTSRCRPRSRTVSVPHQPCLAAAPVRHG